MEDDTSDSRPIRTSDSRPIRSKRPIRASDSIGESDTLAARVVDAIGDEPVAAFSRRAGLAEATIRSYIAGKKPVFDKLVKIADAAGVTVDWLATGRGIKYRRDLADLAQTRAESTFSAIPHGRRWEKIIALVEGIEDEAEREAVLDELYTRAQKEAKQAAAKKELEQLRQAVAALQKKTA